MIILFELVLSKKYVPYNREKIPVEISFKCKLVAVKKKFFFFLFLLFYFIADKIVNIILIMSCFLI